MVDLPESYEEYHTPPDRHSFSETSSNKGQIPPPTNTSAFDVRDGDPVPVDDDHAEPHEQRDTGLINQSDNPGFSEKSVRVVEENIAQQVFVEMPQREQEAGNKEKRKLPFSLNTQKQTSCFSKHDPFIIILNRGVLKMAQEAKISRGGGEDYHDNDVDFLESAMRRGLTLPRPRWWPAEGFKD